MNIKSSNKLGEISFLAICSTIVLGLFAFQSYTKHAEKYQIIVVPEPQQKTALSALQITLKEKHFRKLKKKRNKALSEGILETDDNDYVPGIVTFDGEDYQADIRLKGDWTDHLEGNKWSFRIKLRNDQTIFGMRKFSIHHPKTRGYVNEWLYHKANKEEDLMGLRYNFTEGFINIKVNGQDSLVTQNVGVYAIEEAFDKRTIESNKRKEGLILRISEQYFWKEAKQAWEIEKQTGYRPNDKRLPQFLGPRNEYVATFGLSKIMESEVLNQQFILAKNLLELYRRGELRTSEVFDVQKLAMHTALNNLFGGYHGLEAINLRFYYNPISSKLEPISYDANSGGKLQRFHHYLYTNQTMDSKYVEELILALKKVSQPNYLELLFNNYYKEAQGYESILTLEFGKGAVINKDHYLNNQAILRQELERLKKALSNPSRIKNTK